MGELCVLVQCHKEGSAPCTFAGMFSILHVRRMLGSRDNTQRQEILSANHGGTLYVELALREADNCWPILGQGIWIETIFILKNFLFIVCNKNRLFLQRFLATN